MLSRLRNQQGADQCTLVWRKERAPEATLCAAAFALARGQRFVSPTRIERVWASQRRRVRPLQVPLSVRQTYHAGQGQSEARQQPCARRRERRQTTFRRKQREKRRNRARASASKKETVSKPSFFPSFRRRKEKNSTSTAPTLRLRTRTPPTREATKEKTSKTTSFIFTKKQVIICASSDHL